MPRVVSAPVDAAQLAPLAPYLFLERLVTLECEQAFVCRSQYPASSHVSFEAEWGTDLASCLALDVDYRARDKVVAAIGSGTITFDPAAAVICLGAAGIPTSCSALFEDSYDWADACYVALHGLVADGGVCTTDWQCDHREHCNRGACSR